jgi:poly(A) polymerase
MEADYIMRVAGDLLPVYAFMAYLRAVRAWANARKIAGNGFGYLSYFSWSILATWACRTYQPLSATVSVDELLVHFFQQASKHAWPEPIGLKEEDVIFPARAKRDWMPVLTSIRPRGNSARNLTQSTFYVIREELARAAEAGKRGLKNPAELCRVYTPYQAGKEAQARIWLTLEAQNEPDLECCAGFLEGSLLSLLLNLEQKAELFVRPFPELDRKGTAATLSLEIPGDLNQKNEEKIGSVLLDFTKQFDVWSEKPEKSKLFLYLEKG